MNIRQTRGKAGLMLCGFTLRLAGLASLLLIAQPAPADAADCELYPIALSKQPLAGKSPGDVLPDVFNGAGAGNFGWLTWAGNRSEPTLVKSLTPPGDSHSYTNPDDPSDRRLSVGDWVWGRPGVTNSRRIRVALDVLKGIDIIVPVWDATRKAKRQEEGDDNGDDDHRDGELDKDRHHDDEEPEDDARGSARSKQEHKDNGDERGGGADDEDTDDRECALEYRVAAFAQIRLISYRLAGQNRITARFLGYSTCGVDHLPPTALNQAVWTPEDTPLSITLTGSDPENAALTFTVVNAPTQGTLTGTPPALIYTPATNFHGTDRFTFKANDGLLDSAPGTVEITVTAVNDPPVLAAIPDQLVAEGQLLVVTNQASDADIPANTLTFSLTNAPMGMTIDSTNGVITWTPTEAQGPSTNLVTVNVTDDGQPPLSAAQTFTVTVTEVNMAPVLAPPPPWTVAEGQLLVVTNTATDADLPVNTLTYSLDTNAPAGMAIDSLSGLITWIPSTTQAGLFHFVTVAVTDDGLPTLSATQSFGVTVRRMNRPPVISLTDTFAGDATQPVTLTATVTDDGLPEGGTLSVRWELISGPGQIVTPSLEGVSITVMVSAAGDYLFRLTASDGALTNTALTTLVAAVPNAAPLVTAGPNQFVRLPNAVTLPGFVTDDGKPAGAAVGALWSKVSGPGAVTFAEATATNTSATFSAVGDYVLRLTADDTALSRHADVRIAVRDELVNQPPVVNAGTDIKAGLTYVVFLSGTVTDDGLPAGNPLPVGWQLVSGPGAVEFESTNHTATLATFAQSGRHVLRLSASDGEFTASDELVVDVFATNLPPVVAAGADQVLLVPDPALLTASGQQPRDPRTSLAVSLFGEARWNNTVGQPGLEGYAGSHQLDYSDGNVVVAGAFPNAGGVYVKNLARWDGTNFWPYYDPRLIDPNDPQSAFGFIDGRDSYPRIGAIVIKGVEVYARGSFLRDPLGSGGGVATARWDGEHWLPWAFHGQNTISFGLGDLLVGRDGAVYLVGNFSFQPTNSTPGVGTFTNLPISYGIAKWVDNHWTNLADGVRTYTDTDGPQSTVGAYVSTVAEGKNGEIYVCGLFDMPTPLGGATNIAVWNGTNWAPLGSGIQGCYRYACTPNPRALAVDDDGRLYVGGDIALAGGVPVRNLAMWDGVNWHDVGGGASYEVAGLATYGRDLYVVPVGDAGGLPVNGIARWNGSFWSRLGSGSTNGILGSPMSLVTTPRGIYVAGDFYAAGGQSARGIALWEFPEEPERFVRLNGRVSDDGLPYAGAVTQQWTKASGPGDVIFANASSAVTTATFTKVGIYVLRLTANDTEHTVLDETVIEVRANQPPGVNAGPDLAVPLTDKPVLQGTVTDDGLPSNASVVSVWTQIGGPATAQIANPNRFQTQVAFSAPGTYVFRLAANDSQFNVFDEVTVVVAGANAPPGCLLTFRR